MCSSHQHTDGGPCISCFSVAVKKHCDQGSSQKEEVIWLRVPRVSVPSGGGGTVAEVAGPRTGKPSSHIFKQTQEVESDWKSGKT